MKILKPILFTALTASMALGGYILYTGSRSVTQPETVTAVNGRIELKRIDLASLYPGRVEEILVDRGDVIVKGQVLAKIASSETEARLRTAEAQSLTAEKAVAKVKAMFGEIEQNIKLAEIELKDAVQLRKDGLISNTEYERKKTALAALTEKRKVLLQELAGAEAEVARAAAAKNEILTRMDELTIRSPFDGIVEYRLAEPGNVTGAGGRIISILNPADVTFDLFVPTAVSAAVTVGDDARIVIDGIDAVIPAKIAYISRDAQFTPKFVETREEREKLLCRVTLRIDPQLALSYPNFFKGGMPAIGYIDHSHTGWPEHLRTNLKKLEIYRREDSVLLNSYRQNSNSSGAAADSLR